MESRMDLVRVVDEQVAVVGIVTRVVVQLVDPVRVRVEDAVRARIVRANAHIT